MDKKYNLNISFLRVVFFVAVLLYHLNILKGGYLAVCSFFVLTGYFSCKTLGETKSLRSHYIKRFKKIYLPLLIVVLSTISILNLLKISIFNFKPEITSILLGYNNYWQIGANVDYFAKHISSPFTHLWYISILLQIELFFPIIFIVLKKVGDKISKYIPLIIIFLISIISTIYFYQVFLKGNIITTYYDTFARIFSFTWGVFLGFFHLYFKKVFLVRVSNKINNTTMFILYLILLCILFIFVPSSSSIFAICMIITTLITIKLIQYATILFKKDKIIDNKLINFLSKISYEGYLVQYPVIFIFGYIKINSILKIILIILSIIIISWLMHISLQFKKDKNKFLKFPIRICFLGLILYGGFVFITMKDHTKEINTLKQELDNNQKIMEQKQKEFKQKQQEEEQQWNDYLKSLDTDSSKLEEYVSNLKVVGVGDSIMLDTIPGLYEEFPNGYFDAKVSRSTCAAYDVLKDIRDSGIQWDVLLFNLGTNGVPNRKCKDSLMELAGDHNVFWLTATHADYDTNNDELIKYAKEFDNIFVLDWVAAVKDHPEYLYSDYTHLRPSGLKYYVQFVKESIYKHYVNQFELEKQKLIDEHNEEKKNNINFYGNELLINVYDEITQNYQNASFEGSKNMKYDDLIKILKTEKDENKLGKKLVFAFDKNSNFTKKQYNEIIKLCEGHEIYIITTADIKLDDSINVINLTNKSYFMEDGIHLTKKGNKALVEQIINNIK